MDTGSVHNTVDVRGLATDKEVLALLVAAKREAKLDAGDAVKVELAAQTATQDISTLARTNATKSNSGSGSSLQGADAEELAKQFEETLNDAAGRGVEFDVSVDGGAGLGLEFRVVDRKTGTVVREFPPKVLTQQIEQLRQKSAGEAQLFVDTAA